MKFHTDLHGKLSHDQFYLATGTTVTSEIELTTIDVKLKIIL